VVQVLIKELLQNQLEKDQTSFSLEFFPPKSENGWNTLYNSMKHLFDQDPAYVSVTYGAGGSTRDNTHTLVTKLHNDGMPVVAHLTCEASTEPEIAGILEAYDKAGVKNILALKGDVPESAYEGRVLGARFEHAVDLVYYIKSKYPHFGIGVAGFPEGHPDTPNRLKEIEFLKEKVDAGADYIVTQLFFNNADYFDYVERCLLSGINVPIVPGIMPITTKKGMIRMAELSGGSRFPAKLLKELQTADSDEDFRSIGLTWAKRQVKELYDARVPNIHLYTLNTSQSSIDIIKHCKM
jgi:methylenetetrahydrofolate reductase (NADPH)